MTSWPVWLPDAGSAFGHVLNDPPLNSPIDQRITDVPPVCEPEIPVMTFARWATPCPGRRGNLLRNLSVTPSRPRDVPRSFPPRSHDLP